MADKGKVELNILNQVAHVTFDRPKMRNAMSFSMYAQLDEICARLETEKNLRVIVFRGAGGAFVAGTDISEFTSFKSGSDGVAYEERIDAVITRLTMLPAPTLAAIEGVAVGGGLAIATACDLRIITSNAKFGVPIARTVGNCLSAANIARLVNAFGDGRVRAMLLLSELLNAETAYNLGFASAIVSENEFESELKRQIERLCEAAPITVNASRKILRRLNRADLEDKDVIDMVYASRDFHEGVTAFLEKRKPQWSGS